MRPKYLLVPAPVAALLVLCPAFAPTAFAPTALAPAALAPAAPAALAAAPRLTVVAHRGGTNFARQNSAAAFDHAIREHAAVLETDVRRTRDGVLVLWHDGTVWQRCTGGLGGRAIQNVTWARLSSVRCDGQPIMRLDALVQRLLRPDALSAALFAETKVRGITRALLATARPLRSRLMLQSFQVVDLPAGRRDCLLGTDARVYSVAFATPRVGCVGVPATAASPGQVAAAHAHGRIVWVYTVDDPAQMRHLACGAPPVDGLITDRPDLAAHITC